MQSKYTPDQLKTMAGTTLTAINEDDIRGKVVVQIVSLMSGLPIPQVLDNIGKLAETGEI